MNRFDNIDCMIGMKEYPDKYFDLAIVDPPYGIGGGLKGGRPFSLLGGEKWDSPPDKSYFNELFRVSKDQIIWGGNYFNLGRTRGFIIWDKQNDDRDFSEAEFAWTSFEMPSRIFRMRFIGKKETDHPTEKPKRLYRWILANYAKPNDKILDTHVGSASSLIACEDMGFEYVGFELDTDYYNSACKRLENFRKQLKLLF